MIKERTGYSTLVIEGGYQLCGEMSVDGNKNAALPLLAACLLTDKPCHFTNVPLIKDVRVMIELLEGLGAEVQGAGSNTLDICCSKISSDEPNSSLVGKLRGSVLLYGPLLARLGQARLAPPGGDFPARRTISAHLQALKAMGATEVSSDGAGHALQAPDGLRPASIYMEEASVTGTAAPSESKNNP